KPRPVEGDGVSAARGVNGRRQREGGPVPGLADRTACPERTSSARRPQPPQDWDIGRVERPEEHSSGHHHYREKKRGRREKERARRTRTNKAAKKRHQRHQRHLSKIGPTLRCHHK